MTSQTTTAEPALPADESRPTDHLPIRELLRISLYWLGLSSIFAGLNTILTGRLEFTGLVPADQAGRALFAVEISGAIIAVLAADGTAYHYAGNGENPVFGFRLGRIGIASTAMYSLDRSVFRFVAPAATERRLVRQRTTASLDRNGCLTGAS